jgi:hypothetical protein
MAINFNLGIVGGIVDENVDVPKLCDNRVARFEQRDFVGDVGGKAEAFRTVRQLELPGTESRICSGEIEKDDMSSSGRKDCPMVVPEEARSARDNGDAAGKVEEIVDAAVRYCHSD